MKVYKTGWILVLLLGIISLVICKDYILLRYPVPVFDVCGNKRYNSYPRLYELTDYLARNGMPQWSFKAGMGENIFPYMLRDPFDVLIYIAGKNYIGYTSPLIEILKIVLTGFIFFRFLKLAGLRDIVSVIASLLFAIVGFVFFKSLWFTCTFHWFGLAFLLYATELLLTYRRWYVYAISVFLICISCPVLVVCYWLITLVYVALRRPAYRESVAPPKSKILCQVAIASVAGILLSGLFLLQHFQQLKKTWAAAHVMPYPLSLLNGHLSDASSAGIHTPGMDSNTEQAIQFIQKQDKSFYRIDESVPGVAQFNANERLGYNSTAAACLCTQPYYAQYLQLMNVNGQGNAASTAIRGMVNDPLQQSQNNVKYFLGVNGKHPVWAEIWDSVTEIGNVAIYRNNSMLPFGYSHNRYISESIFIAASPQQRQWITLQAVVIADKDVQRVAGLREFNINDTLHAPLSVSAFKEKIKECQADSLQVVSFEETKITGYVDGRDSEMICFSVPFDAGWHIVEDITEIKPIIINGGMMGLIPGAGRHMIKLYYKLQFLKPGLLMSLAGIIMLLLGIWTAHKTKITATLQSAEEYIIESYRIKKRRDVVYYSSLAIAGEFVFLTFLKWKTNTIYGDDLYIYGTHAALRTFSEQIKIPFYGGQFRPVTGVLLHLLIALFKKNLYQYFLFSIALQIIIMLVFARILNLFLHSRTASLLLSIVIGASRFAVYDITQLYNGPGLESPALIFFLLFLYYFLQAFAAGDVTTAQRRNPVLYSLVFANLCLYTHERYIVIFPFIVFMLVCFPGSKMGKAQKLAFSGMAILSAALYFLIKKYFLALPLLMGTSNSAITFSLSSVKIFFADAVLSIIQVNSGPLSLAGTTFHLLDSYQKAVVSTIVAAFSGGFIWYAYYGIKAFVLQRTGDRERTHNMTTKRSFYIFVFLLVLFLFLLVPPVLQIRLEQRWLQASFCVFVLMLGIVFSSLAFKTILGRYCTLLAFISLFSIANFMYLDKGTKNLFMQYSERDAAKFKRAIVNHVIHNNTDTIYVLTNNPVVSEEKSRLTWSLGGGAFFPYYMAHAVSMVFIDTANHVDTVQARALQHINREKHQVIYITDTISDITGKYAAARKDSI